MQGTGFLGLVGAVLLLAVVAVPASAAVRTATVNDPRDATLHQNVDGTSYRDPYDIKSVAVSYDTAGSISIVLTFFDPLPETDTFSAPSYSLDISERDQFASCEAQYKGDLSLTATVPPDATDPSESQTHAPVAEITVAGYEGVIDANGTISADRTSVVISAQRPVLADRAYDCISAGTLKSGTATFDQHADATLLGPDAIASCPKLREANHYTVRLSVRRTDCTTARQLYRAVQHRQRFPRGTFPRSYNHFGRPFKQSGFTCRLAIRGLAGTEWDIRCALGAVRVWMTRRQNG